MHGSETATYPAVNITFDKSLIRLQVLRFEVIEYAQYLIARVTFAAQLFCEFHCTVFTAGEHAKRTVECQSITSSSIIASSVQPARQFVFDDSHGAYRAS